MISDGKSTGGGNTFAACDFCWRRCRIPKGETGFCGVRTNQSGIVETVVYGDVVALAVDPIEKKPLHHFLPGSKTLSVALPGCNLTCAFCQNHHISQYSEFAAHNAATTRLSAAELAQVLFDCGHPSISFTYSDPIVWQDYVVETAALVKNIGRSVCMVTNGSFTPEALERLLPLVDAWNIDVKGDDRFYRSFCSGALLPVMDSIASIASDARSVLEITTLVIEGIHSIEMIGTIGSLLHDAGVQVWHLSRFFPHYRMADRMPTSERFLSEVLEVAAMSGIPFVYGGNTTSDQWQSTRCPGCGSVVMEAHGYDGHAGFEAKTTMKHNQCKRCGAVIYGRFD